MSAKFEAVIGLEVHCQLSTRSKAFSPDSSSFGGAPNTHVDPISIGHPGTLPVFNERAVTYTVQMGLATHCTIAPRSVFERKHYFYPDLPKGYQISQYESPICTDGYIDLPIERKQASDRPDSAEVPVGRRIAINRIHMEEDAGKSIHTRDTTHTLLDYNRCGVPLIEIVSEPVLKSSREAYLYLRKMRQLVRYLGISDGNMEEGSLRCDANVSIRPAGSTDLETKTEIKNLNSFRNVERAIDSEIGRQIRLRQQGKPIEGETRLWDDADEKTRPMRSKEEAHDYRYFPDPDLPAVLVSKEMLRLISNQMPELPDVRLHRYVEDWNLPIKDGLVLTEEIGIANYFEQTVECASDRTDQTSHGVVAKEVANVMMTQVLRVLNETGTTVSEFSISPDRLAGLIELRLGDRVSSTGIRTIFDLMLEDKAEAEQIALDNNLIQVSDAAELIPVIESILADHPGPVSQYRSGKTGVIGFLIGQVMRTFPGAADPTLVRTLLTEHLGNED